MAEFTIIPVLGRRTDVPQDDPSLFRFLSQSVAMTHDVGGINFDLARLRNTCSKSMGDIVWSSAANATTTRCLGLFELYDGTNRDHIYVDAGNVYVFDATRAPVEIADAGATTFASDDGDYYSFIKVGDYMVFADRGEHTPYKWKNGDANLSKLIASGTEYKFRYLVNFQRRVIGLYSDQTDGDIEIRWSTAWPSTAIAALNFPAANQLYIPNDDPATGGATMGVDRCYIYCENSINQLIYYPDYSAPFRIQTVVPDQGGTGHFSIINMGDRHYVFNSHYGFCEYRGGTEFPYGGMPISQAIEKDIATIHPDYYGKIIGAKVPFSSKIAWSLPLGGSTHNRIVYYDYLTKDWTYEDKAATFIGSWRLYDAFTWNNLVSALVGAGYATPTWTQSRTYYGSDYTWAELANMKTRLVYGHQDGHLYYVDGDAASSGNIDGYRIEPILSMGNKYKKKLVKEVWFDLGTSGDFLIHVWHRSGNTVGELIAESWTSLGTLSNNSPARPALYPAVKSARLHQLKWGTDSNNEKFQVNAITCVYEEQSQL